MASLPDVNVLFARFHPRHQHSPVARRWLDRQPSENSIILTRITQMGALRLLTRPSILGEDLLTPQEFWKKWSKIGKDDRFVFAQEPPNFEIVWQELSESLLVGTSADTDVYLAAFALASGWTLSTFDKGFVRFPNLRTEFLV